MVQLPRLVLGALLLPSFLPMSSSLALVREEKVEHRSALKATLDRVQAKMVKAGMKPRWNWDPWRPLTGQVWNCVQAFVETTAPIWSIAEGVAAYNSTCQNGTSSKSCKEIALGLSEDSLGALGWLLDFPTNCLEFTCGYEENKETKAKKFINPANRGVVLLSSITDALAATLGFATSHFSKELHCDDKAGDTLGDAFGRSWEHGERYWHPGFSSFIPFAKEIREMLQITVADKSEVWYGTAEKVFSLVEWMIGTLQTVTEAQMDKHGDEDRASESASMGCVAAGSHIAASIFAFLGSVAKFAACYEGEWEAYQADSVRAADGAAPFYTPVSKVDPGDPGVGFDPIEMMPQGKRVNGVLRVKYQVFQLDKGKGRMFLPGAAEAMPLNPGTLVTEETWPCMHREVDETKCMSLAETFETFLQNREGRDPRRCFVECCNEGNYDGFPNIQDTPWCEQTPEIAKKMWTSGRFEYETLPADAESEA